MELPFNCKVESNLLSSVFNKTTATYKFYWFLSLLELSNKPEQQKIPIKNILARMICNAWYPVHYFKLSFGFADLLSQNVKEIQRLGLLPDDIQKNDLYQWLIHNENKDVIRLINHFERYVPCRFLAPWLPGQSERDVWALSQTFANNCLYRIDKADKSIEINPHWNDYLLINRKVLEDFCYWNLALFLQSKNPNTPDIPNKLIKPTSRGSLNKQRSFWRIVFNENQPIRCIYTGRSLTPYDFAVEHFIPHSFVSHDLLWNLIPADMSVNSSKSNKIPELQFFLEKFIRVQRIGIDAVYHRTPNNKMLEDYFVLAGSISDLLNHSDENLLKLYYDLLSPLAQIAKNMGFETWNFNLE